MPPIEEEYIQKCDSLESVVDVNLAQIPLSDSPTFVSSENNTPEEWSLTELDLNFLDFNDGSSVIKYEKIVIPIEQNLKDLVREVTGLHDISEVTKLKLRVISRDVGLQRLSIYTPKLTELILDGSYVSTLRDLGCSLVNLKILRVVRCNLKSLDGMLGLETLEELYAGNNSIDDVSSCSSLPLIKVIDVRNNQIKDIEIVSFLCLCETLQHLVLEGNPATQVDNYRELIKEYIPFLKSLDEVSYSSESNVLTINDEIDESEPKKQTPLFEKKSAKIILPKISTKLRNTRPNTTGSAVDSSKILPMRPSTTDDSMFLNTSMMGMTKCSTKKSLTSGNPICGNIVVALRDRLSSRNGT